MKNSERPAKHSTPCPPKGSTSTPKESGGRIALGSQRLGAAKALDELASHLVLSDGAAGFAAECAELLSRVKESLRPTDVAGWGEKLEGFRQELTQLGDGAVPLELPERLGEFVDQLAAVLRQPATEDGSAALGGPGAAGQRRPEWVGDGMLRDFFSSLPDVLDELESGALVMESGAVVDLGQVKRLLHGLKGEAGLLGLDAMAELAHATEGLVAAVLPDDQRGTLLLECVRWFRDATRAYGEGQLPPEHSALLVAVTAPEITSSTGDPTDNGQGVIAPSHGGEASSEPATEQAEDKRTPSNGSLGGETKPTCMEDDFQVRAGEFERDEDTLAVIAEFLDETEEGLNLADQTLMNGERDGLHEEAVHSLFRVFHTIKGVAGFLGLDAITALSHSTENLLNQVRKGTLKLAGVVLDAVFDATETMRVMRSDLKTAVESGSALQVPSNLPGLLQRLDSVQKGEPVISRGSVDAAPGSKLGEILVQMGHATSDEVSRAVASSAKSGRRLGEELVAQGVVTERQVADALRAQHVNNKSVRLKETIKVDVERIDGLVEMIGELVIAESMVANLPEVAGMCSDRAQDYLNQLTKITRDLQRVGLRMRMVQLRTVFQKMARVVRDVSQKSSKEVVLTMSGETAEMDRGMVDGIAEPLVHMIRNAVDHGLEPPDERRAAGKPERGTIHLSAAHKGGGIVIEVSDDGRGLDSERILARARAQGLVGDREQLSEAEVHELLFHPGLSTAAEVTEVSGRGVGMDVVKRSIEALHGRIQIESVAGKGTTFRFLLPITLAIIDGMLVGIGDENYVIPTLSTIESVQLGPNDLRTYAGSGELAIVRGDAIPLIRLDRLFGIQGAKQDPSEGLIVVVETKGTRIGLLVDELITQQQVVIKSLGEGLGKSDYVSGAAILSNGRVGLILNIDGLGDLIASGRGNPRTQRTAPEAARGGIQAGG